MEVLPTKGNICRFPAIYSEGYQIDPAISKAISKFPTSINRSDLQLFFGLVDQLSSSTDTIAELLSPMHSLLSTKSEFVWSSEHDQALAHTKMSFTGVPALTFFDVKKCNTFVLSDPHHGI